MRTYDSEKPLFSLHIPKCGGTSLIEILRMWFDGCLFLHYYSAYTDTRPNHYTLDNKHKTCIHGHFDNAKQVGVFSYYPDACQFVTVVRNPLDLALSGYFFDKGLYAKGQFYDNGRKIEKLGFEDINDYLKRGKSFFNRFFPWQLNSVNYRQVIHDNFIAVGIVEELQNYVNVLAAILGKPVYEVPALNPSVYDEAPDPVAMADFIAKHELEFEIYHYIADLSREKMKSSCIYAEKYINRNQEPYNEIYQSIMLNDYQRIGSLMDNDVIYEGFLNDLNWNYPEYLGKMYYILALANVGKKDYQAAFQHVCLAIEKEPERKVYYQLVLLIDRLMGMENANEKWVVFGTGSTCQKMVSSWFDVNWVKYFVDNDSKKWGTTFLDKPVYPPDQLKNENADELVVIVASQFYAKISNQLDFLGFERFYNYFGYHSLINAEY
jgi:hypothetical protein